MYYRLNLIVPTDNATIQEGRFAAWAASPSDLLLESRKWLKRTSPGDSWTGLGFGKDLNNQGDQTSFPGAPGITPCLMDDQVSVAVGVPFDSSKLHHVTITVVFARNQLRQSVSASPFLTKRATINGSPLKCTFTGAPAMDADQARKLYWFVLDLTDSQVNLSNLIGRYEFNVGALVTRDSALDEFAHDPEMDVGP
ncbi:MAG: hypothetical protein JWO80_3807 [Bryobacterales bacterium]|nr:hypothetical protein [Bryobacterales bacterium]